MTLLIIVFVVGFVFGYVLGNRDYKKETYFGDY